MDIVHLNGFKSVTLFGSVDMQRKRGIESWRYQRGIERWGFWEKRFSVKYNENSDGPESFYSIIF